MNKNYLENLAKLWKDTRFMCLSDELLEMLRFVEEQKKQK